MEKIDNSKSAEIQKHYALSGKYHQTAEIDLNSVIIETREIKLSISSLKSKMKGEKKRKRPRRIKKKR